MNETSKVIITETREFSNVIFAIEMLYSAAEKLKEKHNVSIDAVGLYGWNPADITVNLSSKGVPLEDMRAVNYSNCQRFKKLVDNIEFTYVKYNEEENQCQ